MNLFALVAASVVVATTLPTDAIVRLSSGHHDLRLGPWRPAPGVQSITRWVPHPRRSASGPPPTPAACTRASDLKGPARELWRVALRDLSAAATARKGVSYQVLSHVGVLDPGRLRVVEQSAAHVATSRPDSLLGDAAAAAIEAVAATAPSGAATFAYPSAAWLASSDFAGSHCFRLLPGDDSAGARRLAFSPRDPASPDIVGLLVFEQAATARLTAVRFEQSGIRWGVPPGMRDGSIELRREDSGASYIADWVLRLPRLEEAAGDAPPTLTGILQVGGHTTQVRSSTARVLAQRGAGALRGTIVDSAAHPVAGARVRLAGTGRQTRTDSDGNFVLEDTPAGLYRMVVTDADARPRSSLAQDVSIGWTNAPTLTLTLAGPGGETTHGGAQSDAGVAGSTAMATGASSPTRTSPATVIGRVVDQATGQPVEGVEVGVADVDARVVTGPNGQFLLTVPEPGRYELRTSHIAYGTNRRMLVVPADKTLVVTVPITRGAIPLEPIRVRAVSQRDVEDRELGASGVVRLSRSEIDAYARRGDRNVGDMLQRANPNAVRVTPMTIRGSLPGLCIESRHYVHSFGDSPGCTLAMLVVDGVVIADPTESARMLLQLHPSELDEVEFLPPSEAVFRYGTIASHGAVVVTTRNGGG